MPSRRAAVIVGVAVFVVFIAAFLLLSKNGFQASSKSAKVQSVSIEDKDLEAVPQLISGALEASGEGKALIEEGCRAFVGRQIPVAEGKDKAVWFVTTPGCGWGAHAGPILLILSENGRSSPVLTYGGVRLDIHRTEHHGLRDVVVSNSSAGTYSESNFEFDGAVYRSVNSRVVTSDDPDACKRAPDVFDCK